MMKFGIFVTSLRTLRRTLKFVCSRGKKKKPSKCFNESMPSETNGTFSKPADFHRI